MSDSLLNTFYHYGTAAERALFTPDPPQISAVDVPVLYIWYETDTDDVFIYTTAWKGPFNATTVPTAVQRIIPFTLTNGGSPLTTGYKTAIKVPFAFEIVKSILLSNDPASTVGDIQLDVLADNTFPPTTSITAS